MFTKIMMDLNSHILRNSLLKVQQHLAASGSSLKVATSAAVTNKEMSGTTRISSSFQQQSRSSSEREEDDALKNNPYYSSYAKKLHELKKKDAVAYREALQRLNLNRRNIDNTTVEVTDAIDNTVYQPHTKPKRRSSQTVLTKPKTLNEVMNIDLLHGKSCRDISEIWLAYHRKRDETLVAIIPLKQFKEYYSQSVKYPMFILPLPRKSDGYEYIFTQFEYFDEHTVSNCTVHLTPLISYQTYNENAPECMTVEYYTDLCNGNTYSNNEEDSNDELCVLMRATYNGKLLSSSEAACLINQLRIFYEINSGNNEKEKLLHLFNKGDTSFKHSDVIGLVEKLSIT